MSTSPDATTLFQRHRSAPPRITRERFAPGAIVAARYRIVALLGRGGMGEVYRAEDLRLDQPVALKFLPPRLQENPQALELFLSELRLGRQVSHPNVCRLYDLGDHDGRDFITMEYVDGEDLASLLGRIGKLPAEKAVQIARDIAAGLAAAHTLGIVHRDLKPANVMIDARGRARVTDFGLAVLETSARSNGGHAFGTPAYMAPEQFTGADATTRSDVYALGLILYELLTGEALHDGESGEAIIRERVRNPSSGSIPALPGIDPAVDRLLRRCLDPNPLERPENAAVALRSLPGGDPLEAAVAAGETPSPELVAAAAGQGALSVRAAWSVLAVLIATALVVAGLQRPRMHHLIDGIRSADALRERSQEIATKFGAPAGDHDGWYAFNPRQIGWLSRTNPNARDWRPIVNARPSPLRFNFRQSPRPMTAWEGDYRVTPDNPPLNVPGMSRLALDHRGRLLELAIVPPAEAAASGTEPRWEELFALAELEPTQFKPIAPLSSAPMAADVRRAWSGAMPGSGTPVRIEAAARAGKPVWFAVVTPWTVAEEPADLFEMIGDWLFYVAVPLFTAFLAFRNLRRGRGDRRGAMTFAAVAFLCTGLSAFFRAHHGASANEVFLMQRIVGAALLSGVTVALAYLGLEPYVRRYAPQALISWVRVAHGRVRDTLVGRDTLIGLAGGAACVLLWELSLLAQPLLRLRAALPATVPGTTLSGNSDLLYFFFSMPAYSLMDGVTLAVFVVISRSIARNRLVANALLWIVGTIVLLRMPGDAMPMRLIVSFAITGLVLIVFRYAGVLGVAAMSFAASFYAMLPMTLDPDAFYFSRALATLLVPLVIAGFAFYTSLGGKPILGEA